MDIKERIIEEASRLFFQNGIRGITMSDIAGHLGISKRTLYEVFRDKEELLKACIERNSMRAGEEVNKLINESENVIDALMHIYAKHLNDIQKLNKSVMHDLRKYHPRLYKDIEFKQKEDTYAFIPLFEKGVEQGFLRNDVHFEILVWLLKAQFKIVIMEEDFIPANKYSTEDFVSAIILNFTRGIATQKGYELIDKMLEG